VSTSSPVEAELECIAHAALSQPWGGTNGARNFRILCAVLIRIGTTGYRSKTETTDLESLANDAGLAYGTSISDALLDLQEAGWLKFVVGNGSPHLAARTQSKIQLLPKGTEGRWPITHLPDPRLDLYNRENTGSSGYLIVARTLMVRGPHNLRQISDLTGLSYSTVQRKLKKLVVVHRKVGSSYYFDSDAGMVHGAYGETRFEERRAKCLARRVDEGTLRINEDFSYTVLTPARDLHSIRGGYASSQPVAQSISPLPPADRNDDSRFDASTERLSIIDDYDLVAEGATPVLRNFDDDTSTTDVSRMSDVEIIALFLDHDRTRAEQARWARVGGQLDQRQMHLLIPLQLEKAGRR
jgi:hypothetical protein